MSLRRLLNPTWPSVILAYIYHCYAMWAYIYWISSKVLFGLFCIHIVTPWQTLYLLHLHYTLAVTIASQHVRLGGLLSVFPPSPHNNTPCQNSMLTSLAYEHTVHTNFFIHIFMFCVHIFMFLSTFSDCSPPPLHVSLHHYYSCAGRVYYLKQYWLEKQDKICEGDLGWIGFSVGSGWGCKKWTD